MFPIRYFPPRFFPPRYFTHGFYRASVPGRARASLSAPGATVRVQRVAAGVSVRIAGAQARVTNE